MGQRQQVVIESCQLESAFAPLTHYKDRNVLPGWRIAKDAMLGGGQGQKDSPGAILHERSEPERRGQG